MMEVSVPAAASATATADSDEFNHVSGLGIPYDLFVSKKHKPLLFAGRGRGGGYLMFTNCLGNLVYKVQTQSTTHKLLLHVSSPDPLFTIHHVSSGWWQGFRGRSDSSKNLIFRAKRTSNQVTRTEFDIFLSDENGQDLETQDFKIRGSPFKRSCTIYKGDSILAETSIMYTLGIKKLIVPRSRFRVTIFPGYPDHDLVVDLMLIFFDGRKFWI